MDYLKIITNSNLAQWFFVTCAIIFFIVSIIGAFIKLKEFLGLETKRSLKEQESNTKFSEMQNAIIELKNQRDIDVEQSISHDNKISEKVDVLQETISQVSIQVKDMQNSHDEDKRAEYKDRIGQSYRVYHVRKYSDEEPIPYISEMEKTALEGLIKSYERHGGNNSFVHSVVEPEMETWKVI